MKIKKGDIFIAAVILLALAAWFLYSNLQSGGENKKIVIEINGKITNTIAMDKIKEKQNMHIDLENSKYIDLVLDKDGVYVDDVTCPDKICQKTGKITKPGQSIVCLPNKALIYIESNKASEIDGVSY